MSQTDERIYRTFEEFEREELRKTDSVSASVDEMMTNLFAEGDGDALDFEAPRRRRPSWGDEDDE